MYGYVTAVHVFMSIKKKKNVNSTLFNLLVYCKKYFKLAKIFAFRLFKMAINQTGYFKFEQRSVIKCMMSEKCKQSENYKKMCDMYGEA